MAGAAFSAVSQAVYALLQDTTLQAATPGGWWEALPANLEEDAYPVGLFELFDSVDRRGLGTGNLPEIELRTHVFSKSGGRAESQAIVDLVIGLLKDVALSVTGFEFCGHTFYDQTVVLNDQEINGVRVVEAVSFFRIFVRTP